MATYGYGSGYSDRHHVPTVQEYRDVEVARERAATKTNSFANLPKTAADEQAVPASHHSQHGQPAPPLTTHSDVTKGDDGLRQRHSRAKGDEEGDNKTDDDDSATMTDLDNLDKIPREDEPNGADGGQKEKDRLKAAAGPKDKPAHFKAKGTRKVRDPTTGGEVIIRDAGKHTKIDPKKLDSHYPGGFSTNFVDPQSDWQSSKFTAPNPTQPSNVLLYPFPPAVESTGLKQLRRTFDSLALALATSLLFTWLLVAFGAGWVHFFLRTAVLTTICVGGCSALGVAGRRVEKDIEDVRMHMHRARGEAFSPPMPESVEWLNAAIATFWKQIDPATFVPIADQVEDVMQQSLPGFIDAVKVDDLGIGTNAFRFIAIRGLSDLMTDKEYPREEWITQSKRGQEDGICSSGSNGHTEEQDTTPGDLVDVDKDGVADADESGDFLNYEISFSYSARPGASRSDNIHLMIEFYLGAYDLFQIPFPVWVQIEHISGTVRLRCQVISEAPYIRNLTFSLMGVPRVEVSVVPMLKALPNVLDLPLISGFVQSSIAAAANEYVAPKSMTLNMAQMLAGGGVKKDTDAIGVIAVQISHAENLSAQDANGKSDPYIIASLAKFGRPLYSSRIIFEDLNPVWNETCFVLITKDDIKADEKLSLQLWDSDKRTADDIIGRVSKDVAELVKNPNKFQECKDKLMGFEDADSMQGCLHYKVGFFEKASFNKALMESGKKEDMEKVKAGAADSQVDIDALHCPPDPQWPCGILSVLVEHIDGLENRDVEKGYMGKAREGTAGQDIDNEEGQKKLPCSYCEIILNDDIVYKTRVKQYTNAPFFNAGREIFVRDWTETRVAICVRDARLREHDPIMGIVAIPLKELFKDSSQLSRSFSLSDGVAFGKIHLSFVFRSVQMKLPRALLGSDTATVELLSPITIKPASPEWESKLAGKKIVVSTGDTTQKIDTKNQDVDAVIRLPVYDRFSSSLAFDIGPSASFGPLGGKPDAIAAQWLCDIVDNEQTDLEIPILVGPNLGTLKRNYISEETHKNHKYEIVGKLCVRIMVDPGLDLDHEKLAVGQTDRHEFEVFNRLEGMPKRAEINSHANHDGVIDRNEKKEVNKAKSEALHARHRGSYGYQVVRTSVWAKDGLKTRARNLSLKLKGKKDRDQTVASET
ncbi:hypothetical protein K437DRAFT_192864 [Tilletiaria anomala UBC 951]|uniref:C2 domain-containing protein n=1 Tax=Tilletiaria anomala (strain ATCC 24038 / CBS 436.72 / UBC 951) TaxID=1037660 RepID=A0A066VI80_TILAU|nr:uncharacterized protein K437DRAFT_192864 [Tilletiaria anomala UBC 951]KDN40023.1 hypothetical protein K437DRAFT_192864 [Tilletiaria anomala UBC 951]